MIMTVPATKSPVEPLVEPRGVAEGTRVHVVVSEEKATTIKTMVQTPEATKDLRSSHHDEVPARG
jgi:hypothetical protein